MNRERISEWTHVFNDDDILQHFTVRYSNPYNRYYIRFDECYYEDVKEIVNRELDDSEEVMVETEDVVSDQQYFGCTIIDVNDGDYEKEEESVWNDEMPPKLAVEL